MDDWETAADALDAVVPKDVAVNKWADEDAEEPAVESWDAEPEEKKTTTKSTSTSTSAAAAATAKKAALTKTKLKHKEEEERRAAEKKARELANDPAALAEEKRKRQAILEGVSAGLTEELFAGASDANAPTTAVPVNAQGDDMNILAGGLKEEDKKGAEAAKASKMDDVVLKTDADYDQLAKLIVKKLVPKNTEPTATTSKHLLKFLHSVTKPVTDAMRLDEIAELKRIVTALHNEKTAAQKNKKKDNKKTAAQKNKKKDNKKKTVKVGGGGGAGDQYDDEDGGDYDFI